MTADRPMLSRRDMWLHIALAVARDGLPEPTVLTLHGDNRIVTLTTETAAAAAAWGQHCDRDDDGSLHSYSRNGVLYMGDAHGWHWQVRCPQADTGSGLAEQVVAAIEPAGVPA